MKCERCGNKYPSQGYFAVPGVCETCFKKLSVEEQNQLIAQAYNYANFSENSIIDKRVGFGRRLAAFLVDVVILMIIQTVISYSSGLNEAQAIMTERMQSIGFNLDAIMQMTMEMQSEFYFTLLSIQVIYVLYYSLEMMVGATLGKLALGIQIADKDGKPASNTQLIKRFAFKNSVLIFGLLSAATHFKPFEWAYYTMGIIVLISCLYVLSSTKMGFHDMWAKTAVFKKRDLETQENAIN